jgi:hypothetical protein
MPRFLAGLIVGLVLASAAGSASAADSATLSMNRTAWLKLYDHKESLGRTMTEVWAAGVSDALYLSASSNGCSASSSPSGAATAAATADMLRSDDEVLPLSAAIVAFQRLSGCDVTDQLLRARRR